MTNGTFAETEAFWGLLKTAETKKGKVAEAGGGWFGGGGGTVSEVLTNIYAPQTTTTRTWQPVYTYAPSPSYAYQVQIESPGAEQQMTTKKEQTITAEPSVTVIPSQIFEIPIEAGGGDPGIMGQITAIASIGVIGIVVYYVAKEVL